MRLFFALALILSLAACTPGSGLQVGSSLGSQPDISAPASAASFELYSWHNGQDWAYALFESAARISSFADITGGNDIIIGTDEMITRLSQLPRGTRVYWNLKRIRGFSLPDQAVIEKTAAAAKKHFIQLEIIAWPA